MEAGRIILSQMARGYEYIFITGNHQHKKKNKKKNISVHNHSYSLLWCKTCSTFRICSENFCKTPMTWLQKSSASYRAALSSIWQCSTRHWWENNVILLISQHWIICHMALVWVIWTFICYMLKGHLRGCQFVLDVVMKIKMKVWFHSKSEHFYHGYFTELMKHCVNCRRKE